MRLAIIGQQAFGKAVLEAFLARGAAVAAVYCAPEKPGAKPDPLRAAAAERGVRVLQLPSLRGEEAAHTLRSLEVDLAVMAYVVQFAPQQFLSVPKHGTIQYHPSLLPRYRGPSSINWPIIKGDRETGLSIFRPSDGLDEGPVILQKTVAIGPDDTLGSVYFERLFPLGVAALLEAADLVVAGRHQETPQREELATYEGWCRDPEARINWHAHVDQVYDLIRGCNPAPGAWTLVRGRKVRIYDLVRHRARTFGGVVGKPGEVCAISATSVAVTLQGGRLELLTVRLEDGAKTPAAELAKALGLAVGAPFES
ncbi:MAG TPA: methionyl-tRNA formyltransferase [Steroidobacteraceae bacterium]|nr:methionyl-tRNA formyltransferase [Steroidobacteraceae bacterium]